MQEFLSIALAFPTVVFTMALALLVLYWLTVIIGVADVDLLDGAFGKAEGLLEAAAGKAEGALEAAAAKASGALEAATAKTEAGLEAAAAHASEGAMTGLLSALRLRRAPATVVLSFLLLFAWIFSFAFVRLAAPALPLPTWLEGGLAVVGALALAWPLTALTTYPIGAVYRTRPAVRHADLVGRTVVVSTSRVDARFGEAELPGGGPGLLLQVRCAASNDLARGHEALIVGWDTEHQVFDVEPLASLVGAPRDGARRG